MVPWLGVACHSAGLLTLSNQLVLGPVLSFQLAVLIDEPNGRCVAGDAYDLHRRIAGAQDVPYWTSDSMIVTRRLVVMKQVVMPCPRAVAPSRGVCVNAPVEYFICPIDKPKSECEVGTAPSS